MRKYLTYSVLGLCILALLFSLFPAGGFNSPPRTSFPEKLNIRLDLPAEVEGESQAFRKLILHKDGVTPDRAEIVFRNGETGVVFYRPDFSVREYRIFYAQSVLPSGVTEPATRVKVHMANDGKTILSEHRYRSDGSRSLLGSRLENGHYETLRFFEDGKLTNEVITYREDGGLAKKVVYFEDGKTTRSVLVAENVLKKTLTTFYPTGVKATFYEEYGNTKSGTAWYPNGNLRIQYENEQKWEYYAGYWVVNVSYHDADGSFNHKRTFWHDRMEVERVLAGGEKYTQVWKMVDTNLSEEERFKPENFVLKSVKFDQFNSHKEVTYAFVDEDGIVMEERFEVDVPGGKYRSLHYIRADGSIAKREVRDGSSKVITEKSYEGDEFGTVILPNEVKDQLPYLHPPLMPSGPEYYGGYP